MRVAIIFGVIPMLFSALLLIVTPKAIAAECRTKVNHWAVYYQKGEKYLAKGKIKKAQTAFLKSLWGYSEVEKSRSYLRLAQISETLERPFEAELFFKKALQCSKTRQVTQAYSQFLTKHGHLEEAKKLEVDSRLDAFHAEIRGEN